MIIPRQKPFCVIRSGAQLPLCPVEIRLAALAELKMSGWRRNSQHAAQIENQEWPESAELLGCEFQADNSFVQMLLTRPNLHPGTMEQDSHTTTSTDSRAPLPEVRERVWCQHLRAANLAWSLSEQGQAGGDLVSALRQQGYQGVITLVGDEPHPPYPAATPV